MGKHARGTQARVHVAGAPEHGLHVSVRNPLVLGAPAGPSLPGSGAGLLGLAERVTLAGGVLVHGPDDSGAFVVDADLLARRPLAVRRLRDAELPAGTVAAGEARASRTRNHAQGQPDLRGHAPSVGRSAVEPGGEVTARWT